MSAALALLVTPSAGATDFTDWLGRQDWRVTATAGVAVDGYGRKLAVRTGTVQALRRELTAQLLLEALGAPNIPYYPALATGAVGAPAPVGDAAVAADLQPVLLAAIPAPAIPAEGSVSLLGDTSARLAVLGLVRFVLGSRVPLPHDVAFVKDIPVAAPMVDAFATSGMGRRDAFLAIFRTFPLDAHDAVLEAIGCALTRLENLNQGDWNAILGPDFGPQGAEVQARARVARYYLYGIFPSADLSKLAAERSAFTRPLVRLPVAVSVVAPEPPAREALWSAWHGTLPPATPIAPLQKAVAKDGRGTFHVLPHQAVQWKKVERDEAVQLAATENSRTIVVGSSRDQEGFAIMRLARASGARVLLLNDGHGSRLDEAVRQKIVDEYQRHAFDRIVLVEHPPEDPGVEHSLATDPRFQFLPVDHHRYTARKLDRQHARSSLEQVAEILGAKLSPTYRATALRDRGNIEALLGGGFDRGAVEAEFQLPMTMAQELVPVETAKGTWHVLGGQFRNSRRLGDAVIALTFPSVPNILDVRPDSIHVRSSESVVRRIATLADSPTFAGVRIYEFGERHRTKVLAIHPVDLVGNPGMRAEVEKVLESVAGSELVSAFRDRLSIPAVLLPATEALAIKNPAARAAAIADSPWALLTDKDRSLYLETAAALTLGGWLAEIALEGLRTRGHAYRFLESDLLAFVTLAENSNDPRWLPFLSFVQMRHLGGAALITQNRAKVVEAKLLAGRCGAALAN